MHKKINTAPSESANTKTTALLLQYIAIAWLLAKLIGWKLWIKDRQFPLVPIADFLNWPPVVQYVLFVLSIGLITALIFRPINKIILLLLLCTEITSGVADQNRWQPWEYQYVFTVLICLLNFKDHRKVIACIAFVLISTYVYSGIGKLNEGYLVMVWENTFLKKVFKINPARFHNTYLHYSGYITAVIEIVAGAGLLFAITKKAAAWTLIVMHGIILYAIGPLGTNYNVVVWPWNLVMSALLYFIFIRGKNHFNFPQLWQGMNKIVLICWAIMPALNYAGLWDHYFSSRLYSGELPQMAICLGNDAEMDELQPYISTGDKYNLCNGKAMVNLQNWAMKEMNVPPCPQLRLYNKIEQWWKKNHPGTSTVFIKFKTATQKEVIKIP